MNETESTWIMGGRDAGGGEVARKSESEIAMAMTGWRAASKGQRR